MMMMMMMIVIVIITETHYKLAYYKYVLFCNVCCYCYSELFGFDILLDENFKPWVLEVNLSPSLAW